MPGSTNDGQRETVIREERPSWLNYCNLYFVIAVLCIFDILSGFSRLSIVFIICGIILVSIKRFRYLFTVTTHRVIVREGIIARNTNEMRLNNIRNLNVRQGPVERMFNVGTVIIISAADGGAEVVFSGVDNPHNLKERIYQLSMSSQT